MDLPFGVLYLTDHPDHADAWWRLVSVQRRLAEAGVDARLCWVGPDQMPTESVAGRVVVLQRVIVGGAEHEAHTWVDRLRAAGALAVIADFDDDELTGANIDHMQATQPLSQADVTALQDQRHRLLFTLTACDGVTVSTEPLAEVVRRYTDKPVIVCPNAIDVEWFRARLAPRAPRAEHLTIGWAGWRRPDADLADMAIAWGRIAKRYPEVRFVVAGHQPDIIYRQPIDLDRIIRVPIAPLDEYPKLHQVDIGCCAVADSPFSRCKSPIKAWEYALAGALTVGTRLLYEDAAFFTADTADEWEDNLAALITSPAEWRAQDARDEASYVEQHHSLVASLDTWARAYQQIVEARAGVLA